MKKVFKVLGFILLFVVVAVIGMGVYVKTALPNVGPPQEMKVELTPERIKRGEYLATAVMVCMDCHSKRDWSKFSGPVTPGTLGQGGDEFNHTMGFPGTYFAANITPAGIGNWTDGEVFRAITTGVRKNGKPIFPVMPHANYGKLDEEDIKSVIAYLRTLPSIENSVPESESDFPMNFIINTIPAKANLQKMPSPADQIKYGKYLVTAASCFDCHTQLIKGEYLEGMDFAGGRTFEMPGGVLSTANITPDTKTGIGSWTQEQFLNKFKLFRDSSSIAKPVAETDFNSMMPWTMYAKMKDEDLAAIYAYLRTIKPISNSVVKFKPRS
ncbi:cytochrome c [Solitalea sp. MAHUQ-68]|uniref:Cytochrome c n=1 Tax=Solitalea agri TaxID=2953739 RepID=A0A9X2JEJ9_9SPHI|nr:c-type cytochrome [Solitalea agri]MCO4294025.1 cytochrome c [Solitalea agri]